MSYRKVEPRMWDDERFAALSKDAKLTWLCVLTGPHTTPLPGLSVCGIATLSESMRDRFDTVSDAVKELSTAGLLRFNPTTRVVQVPNAPKYNPCANQRVLKGWFSAWKSVPDCAEKFDHIGRLRAALDESQAWVRQTWGETFGTVKIPDRYGLDTVSETVSNSGAGAGAGAVAGGGAGETAPPSPVEATPSPPGVPPSGATSAPPPEAPKVAKGKRPKPAPQPDTIPLPGTPARRVFDAIVGDRALAPIVANPGDASQRWADPDTFPGVDVLAEVRRAGEYAATKPGRYTDGRAFLRGWLQRKADEVARMPKPAGAFGASPAVAQPTASQPHAPRKVFLGDEFAAAAKAAREDAR